MATYSLSGVVKSNLGELLSYTIISITNEATGITYKIQAGSTGNFSTFLQSDITYEIRVKCDGYKSKIIDSFKITSTTSNYIISMEDLGLEWTTLEGFVVDVGTLKGISGAKVDVGTDQILTDSSGYFKLEILKDYDYTLFCTAAYYRKISISNPATNIVQQIQMSKNGLISGIVMDEVGNYLSNIQITMIGKSANPKTYNILTDISGLYDQEVIPDTYTITIDDKNYETQTTLMAINLSEYRWDVLLKPYVNPFLENQVNIIQTKGVFSYAFTKPELVKTALWKLDDTPISIENLNKNTFIAGKQYKISLTLYDAKGNLINTTYDYTLEYWDVPDFWKTYPISLTISPTPNANIYSSTQMTAYATMKYASDFIWEWLKDTETEDKITNTAYYGSFPIGDHSYRVRAKCKKRDSFYSDWVSASFTVYRDPNNVLSKNPPVLKANPITGSRETHFTYQVTHPILSQCTIEYKADNNIVYQLPDVFNSDGTHTVKCRLTNKDTGDVSDWVGCDIIIDSNIFNQEKPKLTVTNDQGYHYIGQVTHSQINLFQQNWFIDGVSQSKPLDRDFLPTSKHLIECKLTYLTYSITLSSNIVVPDKTFDVLPIIHIEKISNTQAKVTIEHPNLDKFQSYAWEFQGTSTGTSPQEEIKELGKSYTWACIITNIYGNKSPKITASLFFADNSFIEDPLKIEASWTNPNDPSLGGGCKVLLNKNAPFLAAEWKFNNSTSVTQVPYRGVLSMGTNTWYCRVKTKYNTWSDWATAILVYEGKQFPRALAIDIYYITATFNLCCKIINYETSEYKNVEWVYKNLSTNQEIKSNTAPSITASVGVHQWSCRIQNSDGVWSTWSTEQFEYKDQTWRKLPLYETEQIPYTYKYKGIITVENPKKITGTKHKYDDVTLDTTYSGDCKPGKHITGIKLRSPLGTWTDWITDDLEMIDPVLTAVPYIIGSQLTIKSCTFVITEVTGILNYDSLEREWRINDGEIITSKTPPVLNEVYSSQKCSLRLKSKFGNYSAWASTIYNPADISFTHYSITLALTKHAVLENVITAVTATYSGDNSIITEHQWEFDGVTTGDKPFIGTIETYGKHIWRYRCKNKFGNFSAWYTISYEVSDHTFEDKNNIPQITIVRDENDEESYHVMIQNPSCLGKLSGWKGMSADTIYQSAEALDPLPSIPIENNNGMILDYRYQPFENILNGTYYTRFQSKLGKWSDPVKMNITMDDRTFTKYGQPKLTVTE